MTDKDDNTTEHLMEIVCGPCTQDICNTRGIANCKRVAGF